MQEIEVLCINFTVNFDIAMKKTYKHTLHVRSRAGWIVHSRRKDISARDNNSNCLISFPLTVEYILKSIND